MKRIPATLLWASSLLLLLAAASCTDTLVGRPDTDDRTITFQTPQADTRAAVTGTSLTSGSFLVWGWYDDGATNVFDAETVTGDNGVWTYEGTRYWKAGETYNFYAVYPVFPQSADGDGTKTTATVNSSGEITVTGFNCSATGDAAVDLMTASLPGVSADEMIANRASVGLKFRHELCKVQVQVRTGQGVTATVRSASLYGMDIEGTLTRNATGSSWTELDNLTDADNPPFSVSPEKTIESSSTYDLFGELLLIPQGCDNLKLSITIQREGKGEKTQSIPLNGSITRWTAGSSYRYVLTIEADAITFSNFTVDEWGETHTGGDINIGTSDNS